MSSITTIQATDLITNSRADINNNFSNLNTDKIETSVLDTDTTLAANSDAKVATQKAVKAYVDAGGNVNASTTTKGIVELATTAQVDAGTSVGETGAALVVTPDALKASQIPIVRTYLNAVSPATWSKPAGLKYIIVEVQASGGSGASVTSSDRGGGGGGGGGYGKKLIGVASLGSTETVTIGAVGATSSFGTHVIATNGANATANSNTAGAGGSCTGGDVNIAGGPGQTGSDWTSPYGIGGKGGDSMLGNSAPPTQVSSGGSDGSGYGAGGAGGAASGSSDQGGGVGAPAIVIVTEHYV